MLIGYNNDIEHRGKTFHIQTEDRGATDHRIETQLFHGGAILDTKITSYEELVEDLKGEKRDQKIQSVMKASHRSLFKNLLAGKYDEQVGLEPKERSDAELRQMFKDKVQEFQPGQDRVPQQAVELEEEGIDALEQEAQMEGFEDPGEDHMGLSQLKDKLEDVEEESVDEDFDESDIDLGGESDEPDTRIIDPPSDAVDPTMDSSTTGDEKADVVADTDKLETVQVQKDELSDSGLDTQRLEDIEASWEDDGDSIDVEKTGVAAWQGCEPPDEDLSIVELIEDEMAG